MIEGITNDLATMHILVSICNEKKGKHLSCIVGNDDGRDWQVEGGSNLFQL
jgi:hypothetical protein